MYTNMFEKVLYVSLVQYDCLRSVPHTERLADQPAIKIMAGSGEIICIYDTHKHAQTHINTCQHTNIDCIQAYPQIFQGSASARAVSGVQRQGQQPTSTDPSSIQRSGKSLRKLTGQGSRLLLMCVGKRWHKRTRGNIATPQPRKSAFVRCLVLLANESKIGRFLLHRWWY